MNELVGRWGALTIDEDHVLGHLVRRHGVNDLTLRVAALDELVELHANHHSKERAQATDPC
jgi:hypothetical protein